VARVGICGGGNGEKKSAWFGGREGVGIIVVGISSFSNKQNPLRSHCWKVSIAMSKSGGTSLHVEVLIDLGWVLVRRADRVCAGNAWWCIVSGWQVKEDVVAGITAVQQLLHRSE